VPRDGTATRAAILAAAVGQLKAAGVPGFSIEGVAGRAGVAKGLVLYHFGSRAELLARCAAAIGAERRRRLTEAARGPGMTGVDGLWAELLSQHADGTARASLSLAAAGLAAGSPGASEPGADLLAQARGALLDGCAVALAAGVDPEPLREAYDALALALLDLEEGSA
jgi:TetR/AcrR family fatty acid metabolism transcriptional regulator